jgi:hypothetical protein
MFGRRTVADAAESKLVESTHRRRAVAENGCKAALSSRPLFDWATSDTLRFRSQSLPLRRQHSKGSDGVGCRTGEQEQHCELTESNLRQRTERWIHVAHVPAAGDVQGEGRASQPASVAASQHRSSLAVLPASRPLPRMPIRQCPGLGRVGSRLFSSRTLVRIVILALHAQHVQHQ